ncbi:MAG: CoxG family protein, partial [Dehalococcoidia bacterium]
KFEIVGNEYYQATMRVGVGSIKGTYTGSIRVAEKEPMSRYKLVVEGGGAPGRMQGEGTIFLQARDGATEVAYSGDVEVMGPVAGVGQRLMSAAARLLIDQFFKCLERQIAPGHTEGTTEATSEGSQPSSAP